MDLEWDEAKRRLNLTNHGLDFGSVPRFDFENATYIPDDRKDYGEVRIVATGHLDDRLCVLCFTMRREALRIISLRKANDREKKRYQQS
jgi:uncharacterized protein